MQMEAERNSAIERENKILLGKMYSIMNSEPAYKTDYKASVTSLNMTVRKQEYDRIARENQAIMQRILQREPHFDRVKLDEDWKVHMRAAAAARISPLTFPLPSAFIIFPCAHHRVPPRRTGHPALPAQHLRVPVHPRQPAAGDAQEDAPPAGGAGP